MNEVLLGAGEAARRLGVSPATIQRWVDGGVLSSVRTDGGHRRVPVSEVRRVLSAERPDPAKGPLQKWVRALFEADAASLSALMLAARRRSGSWSFVAEDIAAALAEVGVLWELGTCKIFEEHAASEALRRAAASCSGQIALKSKAPSALLLTVAGDRHTLGLSLSELIIAEAGWRPRWLGDGPPAEELGALIEWRKPDLLVVAASRVIPRNTVWDYQAALERAMRRKNIRLVLAGDGPWTESKAVMRVYSFHDLSNVLEQWKSPPRRSAAR
jgi:excisionase family DNA binding protein